LENYPKSKFGKASDTFSQTLKKYKEKAVSEGRGLD